VVGYYCLVENAEDRRIGSIPVRKDLWLEHLL
jgi:hypothetical protein